MKVKRKNFKKPTVIALSRIASVKLYVVQLEQNLLNSLRTRSKVEPFVEQDEAEDLEEKLEYLPEV